MQHEIFGKTLHCINLANSSFTTKVILICALTALHVLPSFDDLKNSLHSTLFSHENVKRWCFLFLSDYAQQQQLEGLPKCNLLNVLIKMYSFFKGQSISKCLFGIFNTPKKWTKKFYFSTMVSQVEFFFVQFLGE